MSFESFHNRFPEIAEAETREITVFDDSEVPADSYGLLESYCNDKDCDCRRVFLAVLSRKNEEIMAVIAFGWASKAYYAKWYGKNDPLVINELKGPVLNLASNQSSIAPALLTFVDRLVLHDQILPQSGQTKWRHVSDCH